MPQFDQTRLYLAKVLPWPQPGEQAFINLTYSTPGHQPDRPFWAAIPETTIDKFVSDLSYRMGRTDTVGIYVCMSSQSQTETKVGKNGKPYIVGVRSQENVVALKSLFLDIDIKPSSYPDLPSALTALAKFLTDSSMPRPNVTVFTGGGLHVYWTFDKPISRFEWQPLANALAEATKAHGLTCDTQCTIDSARILRVPETWNKKQDVPRPVLLAGQILERDYTREELGVVLAPYVGVVAPMGNLTPRAPLPVNVNDELGAGVEAKAPPTSAQGLVKACPFMADAFVTGGATLSNPLWNLTTLASTFTDHGRVLAHILAKGHPDYTQQGTDELYDRKEQEKVTKDLGWPSCRTISGSGATQCQSCPHFSQGKTPFHFVERAPLLLNPSAVNPGQVASRPMHLPSGYNQHQDGTVWVTERNDEGVTNTFLISSYPMSSPWLQRDPWVLHFETVTEWGKPAMITLPLDAAATQEMRSYLQTQGLMIKPKESPRFGDFMVAWIKTLQSTKDAVVNAIPYGWSIKGGKIEGFNYAGHTYSVAGSKPASNSNVRLAKQYSANGEKKPWMACSQIITMQGRPGLDVLLASSFGTPLVHFTSYPGLLLSCYSKESGIGKSTVLKIAQAVWGDPRRGIQSLNDTQNSVLNKMGELQALPIYWDELKTEEDTKSFVNLTFQLSLGKEKSRMTRSIEQREVGTWNAMLISASNDSLLDVIMGSVKMSAAGVFRCFEYALERGASGQLSTSVVNQLVGQLDYNYGVIGQEYAEWLGKNHEQIQRDMTALLLEIERETNAKQDERFWIALIGSLLLGARYSNSLGYTNFNLPAMKDFLYKTLADMRRVHNAAPVDMAKNINISSVLASFINDMRAENTLFTNEIWRVQGKPAVGTIVMDRPHDRLKAIKMQVGVKDKMARISVSQLSYWLQVRKMPRHVFIKALEDRFGATQVRGRLGGGTPLATAQEHLIEIDLTSAPEINFLDET